jgi:hypothetical protein
MGRGGVGEGVGDARGGGGVDRERDRRRLRQAALHAGGGAMSRPGTRGEASTLEVRDPIVRLEVRVRASERDRWRDLAEKDDRRTLADWVRWLAKRRGREET